MKHFILIKDSDANDFILFLISYTKFCIVFFEVELLAFDSDDARVLLVELLGVLLELPLAFSRGQIVREPFGVSDELGFLFGDVALVPLVEEVPLPSIVAPQSVVHHPIETVVRKSGPSGSGSHIRHVIVIHEVLPLIVHLHIVPISLSLGLAADELRDEESSQSSFDFPISCSPSDLEQPVIRMKVLSCDVFPKDVPPQLDVGVQILVFESLSESSVTKPCCRRFPRWKFLSKLNQAR